MNIGLVGIGAMGKNHYRVLNSMGVGVKAICDPMANENDFEENVYKDIGDMLSKESLDCAIIAAPTPFHKDIATIFIEKDIPILIEKPVAGNYKDAKELLELSKKHADARVAVGHVERFNPVIIALKKELKDKEVSTLSFSRVGPFPPRMKDVGVLADLSVHDLDLGRYITNSEYKRAHIYTANKLDGTSEDGAEISFEMENGAIGNISSNWFTPFRRRKVSISCVDAYYEADLVSQELFMFSSYKKDNSYLSKWCFVLKGEPLKNELGEFLNFVKTGEKGSLATIEDSLITLELLDKYRGR